jgi:hypothetical protein
MGITTTTSINEAGHIRCDHCGRNVRGDVALLDDNGKRFGVCCARGVDREILLGMIGDAPEPVEEDDVPIAHNALDSKWGPDPRAVKAFQESGRNFTRTNWDPTSTDFGKSKALLPVDQLVAAREQAARSAIAFPLASGDTEEIEAGPGAPVPALSAQKPLGAGKRVKAL